MRKNLLSMALIAALVVPSLAKASFVDASLFGGYTILGMSDVNNDLELMANPGDTVTKFGGGYYAGLEAAFTVMPFLKIGPRVGLVAGSGKYASTTITLNEDATLIPLEVGVSTDWAFPLTGVSIKGGLYAGYGMGTFKRTATGAFVGEESSSGSGFVAEADVQARYSIIPLLSLGLDLGYRLAKINTMKVGSRTGAFVGSTKENLQTLGAPINADMAVDFSGLNIGANLAFNF